MPLKRNYDLSDGALVDADTGFDSVADPNSKISLSTASPMCADNNNYMSVAWTSASDDCYLLDAIDDFKAFHGKFKFRMDTAHFNNSSKFFEMLHFNGSSANELVFTLQSLAGQSGVDNITTLTIAYRDGAGNVASMDKTIPTGSFVDGESHEFSFQYKVNDTNNANTGVIVVDMTTSNDPSGSVNISNETALDIRATSVINEVRFGAGQSNLSVTRTIDFGCLQLSTNGTYDTDSFAYHVRSDGLETNDGSENAPFKYILQANEHAVAGDTIKLAESHITLPPRLTEIGQINPRNTGVLGKTINIDGGGQSLACSLGYAGSTWLESSVSGEYYLNANDILQDPNRIYVADNLAWNFTGIIGMNDLAYREAGTLGTLLEGEYAYGNQDSLGFNTVYYKPKSDEPIIDSHIEIPTKIATNDDGIQILNPFIYLKEGLEVFAAMDVGIIDSASTAGSVISGKSRESWGNGIQFIHADLWQAVACWTRNTGATGMLGQNGTGSVYGGMTNNNNNDGAAFSGTHNARCYGLLSFSTGYEATGNQYCIEVTGSAIMDVQFCTLVGGHSGGLIHNAGDITLCRYKNNIAMFNGNGITGGYGFIGNADGQNTRAEVETAFECNTSFGSFSGEFRYSDPLSFDGGSISISPADTITSDPKAVNASTVNDFNILSNRSGEDYHLMAGTPCADTEDNPVAPIVNYNWIASNDVPPELQDGPVKSRKAVMGCYRHLTGV